VVPVPVTLAIDASAALVPVNSKFEAEPPVMLLLKPNVNLKLSAVVRVGSSNLNKLTKGG
jgi:hypothetical protein